MKAKIVHDDGLVRVTINGITTTYAGNNAKVKANKVYVDKKIIVEGDPRILYVEMEDAEVELVSSIIHNNDNHFSSHAQIQSFFHSQRAIEMNLEKKPTTIQNDSLNDYTESMKIYLEIFNNGEKNTEQLKDLDLTTDEENWLEEYRDPITFNLINIPVRLDKRLYDLDSLLQILQKNKTDPFTQSQFALSNIEPAQEEANALQLIIQKIKEAHQQLILEPSSSGLRK